ncbi:MAG TPA: malonic semialdehyde reductase [Alphaproteobacteria bacterium]|jgi:3-hydroxypropanoate dehydrogenase
MASAQSAGVLDDAALDLLFRDARTHNVWTDRPVSDAELRAAFDLARMGPTSANTSPARYVFVRSAEAKQRLAPALSAGNLEKTMAAPVTVIFGHDLRFYDHLPKLFPHVDARPWFAGAPELIEKTAFRNGTLQGAYFMLAARALGLDCGPMSGFDNAMVDAAFFAGTEVKSNFICSLGHGDADKLFPRSPRFAFDEVCRIL